MIVYKIRNNKTGLFSTGGRNPGWNQKGKTWKTMPGSHLAQQKQNSSCYSQIWRSGEIVEYEDCEIVIYELVEQETINLADYREEQLEKKKKRLAAQQLRSQKNKLKYKQQEQERIRAEIERLKAQLDGPVV